MADLPDHEVLWAAGLFEGEGWFTNSRTGTHWYPKAGVQMADEEIIRRFHAVMGLGRVHGPYQKGSNRKPQWQWQANGREARQVIHRLLPYLGSRRQLRAMEVISYE
jgi:hypothetical protein